MSDGTSPQIRIAATRALLNSLAFISTNMDADEERDAIMQMICQGTQATESEQRVLAYECLVGVAEHYYEKLVHYMQALFEVFYFIYI